MEHLEYGAIPKFSLPLNGWANFSIPGVQERRPKRRGKGLPFVLQRFDELEKLEKVRKYNTELMELIQSIVDSGILE